MELTIKEVIKNMIDELGRAREMLIDLRDENEEAFSLWGGECGEADMLCSDIDSTWDDLDILDDLLK